MSLRNRARREKVDADVFMEMAAAAKYRRAGAGGGRGTLSHGSTAQERLDWDAAGSGALYQGGGGGVGGAEGAGEGGHTPLSDSDSTRGGVEVGDRDSESAEEPADRPAAAAGGGSVPAGPGGAGGAGGVLAADALRGACLGMSAGGEEAGRASLLVDLQQTQQQGGSGGASGLLPGEASAGHGLPLSWLRQAGRALARHVGKPPGGGRC